MAAYTSVRLGCDFFDPEAPEGEQLCHESVDIGGTPAQARKAARELGWVTGVRSSLGRRFDKDYCPAHKPDGEPAGPLGREVRSDPRKEDHEAR
jgi:hypothetical protein